MKKEENKNNELINEEATRILMPRRRFLQNAGIGLGAADIREPAPATKERRRAGPAIEQLAASVADAAAIRAARLPAR